MGKAELLDSDGHAYSGQYYGHVLDLVYETTVKRCSLDVIRDMGVTFCTQVSAPKKFSKSQ